METYLHKQIYQKLHQSRNAVFISDERIDGDSLGSSLALADYMAQHGKIIPVYVAEEIPEKYMMLPRIDQCTTDEKMFKNEDIDLVVVFDCSDEVFVQKLLDLIPGDPTVINIDHHPTNNNFGHINQVVVDAPATASVVHSFFEANQIIPSKDAATCLLTGLCFDTTAFSNSATNERAFEAASKMLLHGARVQDVIRAMFQNRSIAALRVWGVALERLQHEEDVLKTYLTRKDLEENGVTDDEVDGLSNFLNLVTDARALHVLRETHDGNVKVSMRSLTEDVSLIAKENGGGGHKRAAGYTIKNADLVSDKSNVWKVKLNNIG
jgi:bifunctional oligoribonuclease and PAP phosphatase NrnA